VGVSSELKPYYGQKEKNLNYVSLSVDFYLLEKREGANLAEGFLFIRLDDSKFGMIWIDTFQTGERPFYDFEAAFLIQ